MPFFGYIAGRILCKLCLQESCRISSLIIAVILGGVCAGVANEIPYIVSSIEAGRLLHSLAPFSAFSGAATTLAVAVSIRRSIRGTILLILISVLAGYIGALINWFLIYRVPVNVTAFGSGSYVWWLERCILFSIALVLGTRTKKT